MTPTDPLEAQRALADDIDSPHDDIIAGGVTGDSFVRKHRPFIEAALAAPRPAGVDVERLARAITKAQLQGFSEATRSLPEVAGRIAREYDRLPREPSPSPEEPR